MKRAIGALIDKKEHKRGVDEAHRHNGEYGDEDVRALEEILGAQIVVRLIHRMIDDRDAVAARLQQHRPFMVVVVSGGGVCSFAAQTTEHVGAQQGVVHHAEKGWHGVEAFVVVPDSRHSRFGQVLHEFGATTTTTT